MFEQGTDLRDATGKYRVGENTYLGVTTVRDATYPSESLAYVAASRVAKNAVRVFGLHQKGEAALRRVKRPGEGVFDPFVWEHEEAVPAELLSDYSYLKAEYDRQRQADLDRGTVCHQVPIWWGEGLEYGDLEHEVERAIVDNGYACPLDETIGYCQSLYQWLEKALPVVIGTEIPLFNDEYGYAGTCDLLAKFGDKTYLVDFKTSSKTSWEHAIQLGAYANCQYYLTPDGEKHDWVGRQLDAMIVLVQPDKATGRVIASQQLDEAFIAFTHCLEVYKFSKRSLRGVFQSKGDLTWKR
jgi:hypothetical protein